MLYKFQICIFNYYAWGVITLTRSLQTTWGYNEQFWKINVSVLLRLRRSSNNKENSDWVDYFYKEKCQYLTKQNLLAKSKKSGEKKILTVFTPEMIYLLWKFPNLELYLIYSVKWYLIVVIKNIWFLYIFCLK